MTNSFTSPDLAKRNRPNSLCVATAPLAAFLSIATPAFPQAASDNPETVPYDLPILYDCSSYYAIMNYCYSRSKDNEDRNISVAAFKSRDRVLHLIYINDKRAGVLSETSLSNMMISFKDMMTSIDNDCQKSNQLTSGLRTSCDKIIEGVPQPPYDAGQKSGNSRDIVLASLP